MALKKLRDEYLKFCHSVYLFMNKKHDVHCICLIFHDLPIDFFEIFYE